MKHVSTLALFLTLQLVTHAQTLQSLDWSIVNCGRTEFGPQERCKMTVNNNTESPLQGYWLNWYGQVSKVRFAMIDPNSSKTLNVFTNEYWVFADSSLTVAGVYEPVYDTNDIIISPSYLNHDRKLVRPITDRMISGTVSGGERIKEQLAYDVLKYDLSLEIIPDQKFIKGSNVITVKVLEDLESFVFDLDTLLDVQRVSLLKDNDSITLASTFYQGKYWSQLTEPLKAGEKAKFKIKFHGHPREAPQAPKKGGFSWNKTSNCEHWIATSCQIDGADLWFPCKDYQWDEPDSVDLSFTVPSGLQAISNGILTDTRENQNGTTTFFWKVRNPINNYGISLNIAPYTYFSDSYVSSSGDSLALGYWLLPENSDKAGSFYTYTKDYLKFLERYLGPYPFRNEKLGIVEVPFVGMEHQTIIGMGPWYELRYDKYNHTLFHEICHEWFGNMVTAVDWKDYWIQESLDGYMEALYEEELGGEKGYRSKISSIKKGIRNQDPIAPTYLVDSRSTYIGDYYTKGAFLLHTLRYLIGKEQLLEVLRLMAYLDKSLEMVNYGSQCRFTTTDEFFGILERVSQQNFDWFEEVYFRTAELPKLIIEENTNGTQFRWIAPKEKKFNIPLELETSEGIITLDFEDNKSTANLSLSEIIKIDPNGWILFDLVE